MTTTIDVQDAIWKVEDLQRALPDPRTLRSDLEKAEYFAKSQRISSVLRDLRNRPADIERRNREIADLQQEKRVSSAKADEIKTAIREAPDLASITDARERDREHERQRQLRLSLQLLEQGRLLRAPGVAYQRVEDLDARIAEFTTRRDRAQTALDAALKQADALLARQPQKVAS